jgi:hypothetical protein
MARSVLSDLDFNSVSRITNLPNAVADQEPATFAQLKAQIEGLAWKANVRVATQGNIDILSPGATIDSISLSSGNRFLVKAQGVQAENGIYIFNGALTPATRALDANTFDELESAVVTVDEGTDAGTTWRQAAINGSIGLDPISWVSFGIVTPQASESIAGKIEIATQAETDFGADDQGAVTPLKLNRWSGSPKRFSSLVGDGSNTSYAITHNLGTRNLQVKVYRNSGSYDEVIVETRMTSESQLTLIFAAAPAVDAFQVVVLG